MLARRGYEERMLLGLSSDESNRSERKILMMLRERERIVGVGKRPTSDGIPFEFSFSCFRLISSYPLNRNVLSPSFLSLHLCPFKLFPRLPLQKNK